MTDHCPVCEHRPMSQDLCKPNKALRNTAKAYLKTAEKKLADERAKTEASNSQPPAIVAPTPSLDAPTPAPVNLQAEENARTGHVGLPEAVKLDDPTPSLIEHPLADLPRQSIEVSLTLRCKWTGLTSANRHQLSKPQRLRLLQMMQPSLRRRAKTSQDTRRLPLKKLQEHKLRRRKSLWRES